ncbi:MAG: NADPH-dependent 7-cyano-7-deazaguanine reductase QueF [Planctomycetes bacterium]|nr:NADPH-dependent 7-cyano-7-deazaguanine reductase QueF [Planctomycetota bacterium]
MSKKYTKTHAQSGTKIKLPPIETWDNQYRRNYEITIDIPEFTSICPRTGLPDFGKVAIKYIPNKVCAELKSLKYYMLSYRQLGIFYENAMNRILDDFVKCIKPKSVTITGQFNTRGGMNCTISVRFPH